jgi:hypothetical protein
MVASLWGRTKEDESSIGRVWTAGFHHVMACSQLACISKLKPFISLIFQIFLGAAVNRGYGVLPILASVEVMMEWDDFMLCGSGSGFL